MLRLMSKTVRFLPVVVVFFFTAARCEAQVFTWSAPGGGSWTTGSNWVTTGSGSFPNGNNDLAVFSQNSSPKTITLDTAILLESLSFNASQTGNVTIAPGAGGSLTLRTSGLGLLPTLNVIAGSGNHTISANISVDGPHVHRWNIDTGTTFTVSGNIGGTQGLTKQQSGTLLLNGINTYAGATTVSAGTLGGSGSIASAVTVAAGATIKAGVSPSAATLTLGNGLTLNDRYLVTLFSNSSTSNLAVNSGLVTMSSGSLEVALGSGVTVASFRAAGPRSFTIVDAANGQLSGTFSSTNFTNAGSWRRNGRS